MAARFEGWSVIVTGGSAGYGLGTVRRLAAEGARVWATARGEARLRAAVADLPGITAWPADVTDPAAWDRLVAAVLAATGRLDALVNNAGAGIRIAPLDEQSPETITESLAVNLTGAILGCRAAAPPMKSQGRGTIINVLSICAREAWPGYSVYSAAKAGLLQFTNCLHTELRPHGVRATSLIPSWGATEFAAAAHLPGPDPAVRAASTQPDEFGAIVADLLALPPHLTMLDCTVLPLVQAIEPL